MESFPNNLIGSLCSFVRSGVVCAWLFPEVPLLFFFNVYLFLREREWVSTQAGEGEREREIGRGKQNLKQASGSKLSAQSPTSGLNSKTDCDLSRQPPEPPRWPLEVSLDQRCAGILNTSSTTLHTHKGRSRRALLSKVLILWKYVTL